MQSSALQDLAHPLLEFQALTKVLLRRWTDVKVDLEVKEHRLALKSIYLAATATNDSPPQSARSESSAGSRRRHNPEKWRRLGFTTETPAWEFGEVGFLGMMDLTDFVRKDEDGFRKVDCGIALDMCASRLTAFFNRSCWNKMQSHRRSAVRSPARLSP